MRIRILTEEAEIEHIYHYLMKRDFPPNELKPLQSILRAWKSGEYYCFVLHEEQEILGYAFFARNRDDYLLDYLAIVREYRDRGMGTIFLRQLADRFQGADCILVEAEDPDSAQNGQDRILRERRLKFYQQCGCRITDVTSSVFGADYRILEVPTGKTRTNEEIAASYSEIYRMILPDRFFRGEFKVTFPNTGEP